ncbi:MAG: hypothetical protein FJW79_01355 [Actinobacteria bacterium]|nr:hypothetical protein [Actinomycetota bacterium]
MTKEPWLSLVESDPRPWLLESGEPAARWVALTHLHDLPADHPEVAAAHEAVRADPGTRDLIERLGRWGDDTGASGHHSPAYQPNLLHLLADMGLQAGDDPQVDAVVDGMLEHQDEAGRFQAFGRLRGAPGPVWSSLLCDTHAITEVLIRFGRSGHPSVTRAVQRIAADLAPSAQGDAWPCLPERLTGFRGPGRRNDFCPQVTLEALRLFARLPRPQRPPGLVGVARVAVRAWRVRGEEQPYMFGHGYRFKTVKWPAFWYDLHWVLDTVGRYPGLWRAPTADPGDRQDLAEMLACLVAYNFGPSGRVTPRSCYRGFEAFSFGQKRRPSPFATARLLAVVRRFGPLAAAAAAIDVLALPSSKGGSGRPRPPPAAPESN